MDGINKEGNKRDEREIEKERKAETMGCSLFTCQWKSKRQRCVTKGRKETNEAYPTKRMPNASTQKCIHSLLINISYWCFWCFIKTSNAENVASLVCLSSIIAYIQLFVGYVSLKWHWLTRLGIASKWFERRIAWIA